MTVARSQHFRQAKLDLASNPPNVALAIEVSRLQQIKRGLNIYRATRINRIINIILKHLQIELGSAQGLLSGQSISPPAYLLERCSGTELSFVNFLFEQLKTYSVQDTLSGLPLRVNILIPKHFDIGNSAIFGSRDVVAQPTSVARIAHQNFLRNPQRRQPRNHKNLQPPPQTGAPAETRIPAHLLQSQRTRESTR